MHLDYKNENQFLFSSDPLFLGRGCGESGGSVRGPTPAAKTHRAARILFVASGLDLDRGEREKRVWKYGSSTMTAG